MPHAQVPYRVGTDLADKRQTDHIQIVCHRITEQRRAWNEIGKREADPAGGKDQQHRNRAVNLLSDLTAEGKVNTHAQTRREGQKVAARLSALRKRRKIAAHDQGAAAEGDHDCCDGFPRNFFVVDKDRDENHDQRMKRRQYRRAGQLGALNCRITGKKVSKQKSARQEGQKQVLF